MSKKITVSRQDIPPDSIKFTVAVIGDALKQKEQALFRANVITQVTNADEQTAAINAAAVLKGLSTQIENDRKFVKQPYWDAGKAIDAQAAAFVKDIDARAEELEEMIGEFQRIERDKELAAIRAEEARKAAAERAAAEEARKARAAAEAAAAAERRRIEAEKTAAEAKGKAAKAAAQAALDKAAADAAAAEDARFAAEIDASEARDANAVAQATTVTVAAAPTATGSAIREKVEVSEVTDIEAFYAWDKERRAMAKKSTGRDLPSFVRMEVHLQNFNSFINIAGDAELDSIPGIRFTRKTTAAVRSVSPQLTLE